MKHYSIMDLNDNFSPIDLNSTWAANMHLQSIVNVAKQYNLETNIVLHDNFTGEVFRAASYVNQYGENACTFNL